MIRQPECAASGRLVGVALGIVFLFGCAHPFELVGQEPGQGTPRFQHGDHVTFGCAECHASGQATTASNGEWCAACHHVEATLAECVQCHVPSEIAPAPMRSLVTFRLSVAEARTRSLTFDHERHLDLACGDCHAGGAELLVRQGCTDCHVEHHQPGMNCTSCHAEPTTSAHPAEVHRELAGCGAAGCHTSEGIDYAALNDERNLCISCHVAQRDHEVPAPCAECHILGADAAPPRRPDR